MNSPIPTVLRYGALALCIILGCFTIIATGGGGGGGDGGGGGPTAQTIAWQPDGNGFVQYATNDSSLLGTHQYRTTDTIQDTMSTVEVEMKRVSGSAGTGYGITFCFHDRYNAYIVVINTQGRYLIARAVNGVSSYYWNGWWSATQTWTTSSHLNTGMGVVNTIRVVKSGNDFDVSFNGAYETTFTDSTFAGGDSGYGVSISRDYENFPATPSDVRFRQVTPDLSTAGGKRRKIWEDTGGGVYRFLTNDPADRGYYWIRTISGTWATMNSVEIEVWKVYGFSESGYGLMFCRQNLSDYDNYYRVVITASGRYLIMKKQAGDTTYWNGGAWSPTSPSPWPISSNLVAGYGIANTNKIRVDRTGTRFDVYFNWTPASTPDATFYDASFTGGYNGFVASVTSSVYSTFPTPEDVRAQLLLEN